MLKSLGPRTVTISPGGPCLQRVLLKAKKKKKKKNYFQRRNTMRLSLFVYMEWIGSSVL